MKMMNWMIALGTTTVALGANYAEAAPLPFTDSYEVEIGGTDYYPDQSPTTPLWSVAVHSAGSTELASGGILTTNTTTVEDSIRYDVTSGWAPGAAGTTLEARLKVDSQVIGAESAGNLVIGAGNQLWVVRIAVSGLSQAIGAGGFIPTTTNDGLHAYRFTADGTSTGTLNVYKDGVSIGSFASTGVALTTLRFGEDHGSSAGQIQWDYIRWTNAGAFAPTAAVPEPAALSLAAVGALTLLRRRRAAAV
jgi:hypothetical protein